MISLALAGITVAFFATIVSSLVASVASVGASY
jgi:hypothetical protein